MSFEETLYLHFGRDITRHETESDELLRVDIRLGREITW